MPIDGIMPGCTWPATDPGWTVALRESDHTYRVDDWVFAHYGLSAEKLDFNVVATPRHIVSGTAIKRPYFPEFNVEACLDKYYDRWQLPGSKRKEYKGKTREQIKEMWTQKGKDASEAGTQMHLDFENFYIHGTVPAVATDEWRQFEAYVAEWVPKDQMLVPEMTLFSPEHRVCGCADIIAKGSQPGTVRLLDYKRSKHSCKPNEHVFGKWNADPESGERANGIGPCSFMKANSYSGYRVQLNLYKWILENVYHVRVESMHLVRMYPESVKEGRALAGKADVIEVEDCQDVIEGIMKERVRVLRIRRLFKAAGVAALIGVHVIRKARVVKRSATPDEPRRSAIVRRKVCAIF
jgi:hypothetical protein